MQNSKIKSGKVEYINGADVIAYSANPEVSDSYGTFTLKYLNKSQGDTTKIAIQKPNLTVVNTDLLNLNIPADTSVRVKIYMCAPPELAENILKLRGIAKNEIFKTYETKIAQLKKENKYKAETQLLLEEERDNAINQFQELANKIARVNLDDESEAFSRAYNLFLNGDIDNAKSIIDSINIQSNIKILLDKIRLGENITYQAQSDLSRLLNTIAPFKIGLRLAKLEFDEASNIYDDLLLQSDSLDINFNLQAGIFFLTQYKIKKAIPIFNKVIDLSKSNIQILGYSYFLLATSYWANSQIDEAINSVEKAYNSYNALFTLNNDSTLLPFIGSTKVFQNTFYTWSSTLPDSIKTIKANEAYQIGYSIFEHLALKDSIKYTPYLSYVELASSNNNDLTNTKRINSLLDYYRKVFQKDSTMYAPFLANAIFRKCINILLTNKVFTEDLKIEIDALLIESLTILQNQLKNISVTPKVIQFFKSPNSLATIEEILSNPDNQAISIFIHIQLLTSIGSIYFSNQVENGKVLSLSLETLELATRKSLELSKINENRYLPRYLEFASLLSVFYARVGKYEKSCEIIDSSAKIILSLYKESPQTYTGLFATNGLLSVKNHGTYYLFNKVFYKDATKNSLLNKIAIIRPIFLKNKGVPFVELSLKECDDWELCLKRKTYKEFKWLRFYQELTGLGNQSLERNDKVTAMQFYRASIESMENLLEVNFNLDDALVLAKNYGSYLKDYRKIADTVALYKIKVVNLMEKMYLNTLDEDDKQTYSLYCGNTAWEFVLSNHPREAVFCAKKGLLYDETQLFIYTNLALGYLLNNQWDKAIRVYAEYYDKEYQNGKETVKFKLAFLQDIDTIQKKGILHKDLQKIKKLLNSPKDFPQDLIEGIIILNESKKLYNLGLEALIDSTQRKEAIIALFDKWYESSQKIINKPYFSRYFSDDYLEMLLNISFINNSLGYKRYNTLIADDYELLETTASDINTLLVNFHKYSQKNDYLNLVGTMQITITLINEYLKWEKDSIALNNAKASLTTYYGNLATFQLFANQNKSALASILEGLKYNDKRAWLIVKLILANLLNDNYATAIELHEKWKSKPINLQLFDNFDDRLLFEIEKLESAGISSKNFEMIKRLLKP